MPAKFVVEITRSAEADTNDIWNYIARDNPDAADRFVRELERQATRLERFPERCPVIPENELDGAMFDIGP